MTQKTKLPENFVIERDANDPIWNDFIIWLNEKYNRSFTGFDQCYYGVSNGITFVNKHKREHCEIITLEQWNEAVNGKEEIEYNWFVTLRECDILIDGTYVKTHAGYIFSAENFNKNYDRTSFRNATQKEVSEHLKIMQLAKQPRLKVGDKIPEYLHRKINYRIDVNANTQNVDYSQFEVTKVEEPYYHITPAIRCIISEVDALIEEHERESKGINPFDAIVKACDYQLEQLAPKLKKEWIPENGEEVDHKIRTGFRVFGRTTSGGTHLWHFDTIDMAKKFCEHICLKTNTEYDIMSYEGSVAPTTKFISPEQLKIVEG